MAKYGIFIIYRYIGVMTPTDRLRDAMCAINMHCAEWGVCVTLYSHHISFTNETENRIAGHHKSKWLRSRGIYICFASAARNTYRLRTTPKTIGITKIVEGTWQAKVVITILVNGVVSSNASNYFCRQWNNTWPSYTFRWNNRVYIFDCLLFGWVFFYFHDWR